MKLRHPFRARPLLAFAVLGILAGCSVLPTGPGGTRTPGIQRSGASLAPAAEPSDNLPVASTDSISTTLTLLGNLGGTVEAGRFSVDLSPDAFPGVAQVKVTQLDSSQLVCELGITPASANYFLAPVQLTVNLKGAWPPELMRYTGIECYNTATQSWVVVPRTVADSAAMTITAPLQHFSTYQVAVTGRASW